MSPPLGGGQRARPERYTCRAMSSFATASRFSLVRPSLGPLVDIGLAVALFFGSLVGFHAARPGSVELSLTYVVLTVCATVPLSVWRRFPLGVFAVTAVASAALAGIGYLIDVPLGLTAALYLLTASHERESPAARRKTIIVVALLVTYLSVETAVQKSFPAIVEFHTTLVWAIAWFAGEQTRLRSEQIAVLKQRALGAERERLLAVAEERARIARDLHDSAGHSISLIAVRAGTARLRHQQNPNRTLPALEAIEELARQTVGEIDQIVGALRERSSANGVVEAPPGLASLDTLVADRSAAGLEVIFETSGTQRPLGVAADQAVYRIVQEALTNAARHGAGRARVELAFGDTAVQIVVTNPVLAGEQLQWEGHGLIGMRERATFLGGQFAAECASGMFRVRAQILYGGHVA